MIGYSGTDRYIIQLQLFVQTHIFNLPKLTLHISPENSLHRL